MNKSGPGRELSDWILAELTEVKQISIDIAKVKGVDHRGRWPGRRRGGGSAPPAPVIPQAAGRVPGRRRRTLEVPR